MNYTATQISQFSTMIQHGFRYKLYLDDLPSSSITRDAEFHAVPDYQEGIRIGTYNKTTNNLTIANFLVIKVDTNFAEPTKE